MDPYGKIQADIVLAAFETREEPQNTKNEELSDRPVRVAYRPKTIMVPPFPQHFQAQ
jgi:hypothetical protein